MNAIEAKQLADNVTSLQACLNGIFDIIENYAKSGNYQVNIYSDMPNDVSLIKLFNKEHLEYVEKELKSLGFEVISSTCKLHISWKCA